MQGAATLVGDTTSILLGSFADMNFFDFFWMRGRPGIFWGVELGALASLAVLLWLFRRETQPIAAKVETEVEDDVPTALMLLTVGLLIAASFLPEPAAGPLHTVYELRSGLVCMGLCLFGVARACLRAGSAKPLAHVLGELAPSSGFLRWHFGMEMTIRYAIRSRKQFKRSCNSGTGGYAENKRKETKHQGPFRAKRFVTKALQIH